MSGNYSTGRPAGREHVPVYPKGFIAIRIVQLVVAIIVLGLDAYTLSVIETSGNELNIFTVSKKRAEHTYLYHPSVHIYTHT